jgi:hypothetical protein
VAEYLGSWQDVLDAYLDSTYGTDAELATQLSEA